MTDREKLRTRGQYYLFTGNSTKAIEEHEALVKRYPSDSVGLSNLGLAYFQVRQFAKATEMQTRSVALQPNNVPRLNNGALYALYAGRFDDAMTSARKANELNKDYGPAWIVQGLSAAALGQYDVAAAAFTAASAVPGSKASAALGLADLAMLRGRVTDAAAVLEPLLTDKLPTTSHARIHTTLGGVRLAQGRTADAAKLAERTADQPAGIIASRPSVACSPGIGHRVPELRGARQALCRNASARLPLPAKSPRPSNEGAQRSAPFNGVKLAMLGRRYLLGPVIIAGQSPSHVRVRRLLIAGQGDAVHGRRPTWLNGR